MDNKNQFSLLKSSLIITIVMLLSKVLSFVRDMLMARYLGATALSDVILISTSLVLALTVFIRAPFAASYLPIATDVYLLKEEKKAFFGSVYGLALSIGIILLVIEGCFLKPFINILVPGLDDEHSKLLRQIMLLQLPIIPLAMLDSVSDGNLRLLNKFGISEISNAIITLFYVIYFIIFRNNVSVVTLSLCVVLGHLFSFCIRYSVVRTGKIVGRWRIPKFCDPSINGILTAMIPFVLAASARELNSIIDKAVASLLDAGSITIQSYASKMTVTEVGLIATAISTVIYSQVSKYSTLDDDEGLKKTVITGLNFVNTLMFPCCIFTIVFSREIISVLFGHGSFSERSVILTSNTMCIYAIGMIGSGIEEILTRTMHATKHRKYPATVSVITVFINTSLNLLLYKQYGVYGLAAASSFVLLLRIPLYAYYVNKHICKFVKGDRILASALKVLIVSIISGILAYLLKRILMAFVRSNLLILCISGSFGLSLLFVGLLITKNDLAIQIVRKMR